MSKCLEAVQGVFCSFDDVLVRKSCSAVAKYSRSIKKAVWKLVIHSENSELVESFIKNDTLGMSLGLIQIRFSETAASVRCRAFVSDFNRVLWLDYIAK